MNLKNWVTTAGSAFVGGFLTAFMAIPPPQLMSWASARPFVVGAIVTGLAAVYHLYQPRPQVAP